MEVNANDGYSVVGLRLDMLDIVDINADVSLKIRDDAFFHLLRRESVVIEHRGHDRNIDIMEDVYRHRYDCRSAKDGDKNSHYNEGIRPAQRKAHNPHRFFSLRPKYTWGKFLAI